MNLPNKENEYNDDSKSLDLETLSTEYKNLLIQYKQAVLDYVNYLKQENISPLYNTQTEPNYNINEQPLETLKDRSFWGSSSIAVNNSGTLQDCVASCSNTPGCSGATYNGVDHKEPICSLRSGDGTIVTAGLPNDYAIVPKGKMLLMIVDNINEKLTQLNKKILDKINNLKPMYNDYNQKRGLKGSELLNQYNILTEERNKIKETIKHYKTLNETQIQSDISTNQNYYSFLLLVALVIAIITILYKITSPATQSSSMTTQTGGGFTFDIFYFLMVIIVLIIIYFYNKQNSQ
jgi:hypothetical protein